jgi:FTR1 family protein
MLTTAIIAFREFLEAFLLVGMFVGMDKKFQLGKRREILLAAFLGITFSLILPILVFFFAADAARVLTEKNTDLLEGYLLTFSGFFLAYVVFSLHEFMKHGKKKTIADASTKMEKEIFDVSLFFTIVFFIIREGFEVALLIAATSLFSVFVTNIEGLFLGFIAALLVGIAMSISYTKLPIKKIFTYTEYLILLIGAAMVKNGVSLLILNYTQIHLDKLLPLHVNFLPNDKSILGHTLSNLIGLQPEFSLLQFGIMVLYICGVIFFLKKSTKISHTS